MKNNGFKLIHCDATDFNAIMQHQQEEALKNGQFLMPAFSPVVYKDHTMMCVIQWMIMMDADEGFDFDDLKGMVEN